MYICKYFRVMLVYLFDLIREGGRNVGECKEAMILGCDGRAEEILSFRDRGGRNRREFGVGYARKG
jgi:hypothetical protein